MALPFFNYLARGKGVMTKDVTLEWATNFRRRNIELDPFEESQ